MLTRTCPTFLLFYEQRADPDNIIAKVLPSMQSLNINGRADTRVPPSTPAQRLRIVDTSASSEKGEDDNSDNVTSDNRDETWQSGRPAPGYIDLDMGSASFIEHLDLLPYQVPTPAATHHRIWVGDALDDMHLVQEVKQQTTHHQWISGVPIGKAARFVRVETVGHPGWVAWSGIQVFGTNSTS